MTLRVLFPRVRIEELLHLRHPAIRLGTEPQLDLHQRLEARIQVRDAEVDELGQFGEELLVEGFIGGFGEFGFSLGAGQFGWVLVGFFDQLFHPRACRVVVEEFMVAFFDAYVWGDSSAGCRPSGDGETMKPTFVYVGKIGAEAGDGFKHGLSARQVSFWVRRSYIR